MILTLTASIMYWSLQNPVPSETNPEASESSAVGSVAETTQSDGESNTLADGITNLTVDNAASESS